MMLLSTSSCDYQQNPSYYQTPQQLIKCYYQTHHVIIKQPMLLSDTYVIIKQIILLSNNLRYYKAPHIIINTSIYYS